MLRLFLFTCATGLTRLLPLPALYRVGDAIADIAYVFDRSRARALRANLQHMLGGAADRRTIRRLARQGYRHMAMYLAEFFGASFYPPFTLTSRVRVQGQEHLERAFAHGRGVLLLSAHYSNWELCAGTVAYLGYPITVVANQHPDPRTNRLFLAPREHNGVRTVDVFSAVRPTYRLLKENSLVALMADRDLTQEGVLVTFFGKQVRFPKGPARFSIGSHAPAVFTFIRRRPDRTYDQVFLPPILPPTTGDRDANVLALTQQYAETIEREIAKDPTQYTVFFPIFAGEPPPLMRPKDAAA